MINVYNKLVYDCVDDFVFGSCPHPVKIKSGLVIGGGKVYPELNFTLPTISVNDNTVGSAYATYRDMKLYLHLQNIQYVELK